MMPSIRVLPHPEICPDGATVEAPVGQSVCRALLDHGVEDRAAYRRIVEQLVPHELYDEK